MSLSEAEKPRNNFRHLSRPLWYAGHTLMARVICPGGEVVDWPFVGRDKPLHVDAAKLRACLTKIALERAKAAAALTSRELRRAFDKPKRWETLARTWRRVKRWKVEAVATKMGERDLCWCAQGGTKAAFLARSVRSTSGCNVRPRWNAGQPRVRCDRGENDSQVLDTPKLRK